MPQRDIELILFRQLATMLSIPIFLVDPHGDLLFFNEAAEMLLGTRFEELDRIDFARRTAFLAARDPDDNPVGADDLPGMVAMRERRPVHRRLRMAGGDGAYRNVEVAAFPLEGSGGRLLGGVIMFWESANRGRNGG